MHTCDSLKIICRRTPSRKTGVLQVSPPSTTRIPRKVRQNVFSVLATGTQQRLQSVIVEIQASLSDG